MPHIELSPFTNTLARQVLAGDRQADWSAGYPTEGDVEVATRIADATWQAPTDDVPWGAYAVRDVDSGLVAGGAGFHGPPSDTGAVEIGYGIAAEWQGRGLATSAVQQLVDLASRGGATTLVAGTDPGNLASQRVLIKCGFADDGIVEEELRWSLSLLPGARS